MGEKTGKHWESSHQSVSVAQENQLVGVEGCGWGGDLN